MFNKYPLENNTSPTITPLGEQNPQSTIFSNLRDKPLVVYAGTLESYQGIDLLLQGFRSVIATVPEAALLIVGGTPAQVDKYRQLADRCGIGMTSHFTGRLPQAQARYYTNRATVQISSRVSGNNTPLKIYEQLSSGIPIVATKIYSHTQVLDDTVAFLVEPTPEGIAQGILKALKCPEEAKQKADNAQALYENRYSRRVYTEKVKQLFHQLELPVAGF
jgi:glycosyltransferase involved in cell wall biosynthesis